MSRIGKLPITLPKGVEVKLGQDIVEVKGPKRFFDNSALWPFGLRSYC